MTKKTIALSASQGMLTIARKPQEARKRKGKKPAGSERVWAYQQLTSGVLSRNQDLDRRFSNIFGSILVTQLGCFLKTSKFNFLNN